MIESELDWTLAASYRDIDILGTVLFNIELASWRFQCSFVASCSAGVVPRGTHRRVETGPYFRVERPIWTRFRGVGYRSPHVMSANLGIP